MQLVLVYLKIHSISMIPYLCADATHFGGLMMIVEKVEFRLALDLRYYFEILCGLVRAWRPVIESRET
jgi:hypothetical protein